MTDLGFSANGFTKVLHFPNPNDNTTYVKINGALLEVFENFGIEIIHSGLDCKKEVFNILKESCKKYDHEELKAQWLQQTKALINETGVDLRIEVHDLANYIWDSQPDYSSKIRLFMDWTARDTAFTFWRKKEA